MIRFRLECLLIFISIFDLNASENGVHRVSRQDFNTHTAFGGSPASYQQPFESKNGVYRVQRQDFTNTNDVPFSDSYQGSYANRFSKLNFESGNVNRSFTPLPKLFLPAVSRVENPYLSIGLPNYDRVVPASNFGKEFQTRTSAPTRVTLRPQITIYDEKRPNDGALPAIPSSQDESPLPSISEYSKSSPFEEDFSSMVEQFEMTEDRKSICKGANCRRSADDADAVKPILRKRRSLDYDPYYSYNRRPWQNQGFVPYHYRNSYPPQFSGKPFYDHDNDPVYSYLNSLSKNRAPTYESRVSNEEEFKTPSSINSAHSEEIILTNNDAIFISGINLGSIEEYPENSDTMDIVWSLNYEKTSEPESTTTSEPEHGDFYNFQDLDLPSAPSDDNYDPLLSIDFEALVRKVEDESELKTPSYDFNHDDSLYSTETPLESTTSDQYENVTPIECFFEPETTESETDSDSTPSTIISETESTSKWDYNFDQSLDSIENFRNSDDNSARTSVPIESTTNSDDNPDTTSDPTESTTNSDDNPDTTSDPTESTTNSDNSEATSDPSESTTNSEVTTEMRSPESRYFDIDGEPLTPDQKFVIAFVCSMWSELYTNYSELASNDPETKKLNQLCHFLNSIDEHIVVEVSSEPKPDSDSDEFKATMTEKPKSKNANEVFRNYFLQIIEENNDHRSETKPVESDDHGEDADSASQSSANIPIVLTLRDNISK